MSEEDKMKLRYLKEQKEQLKKEMSQSRMNRKRSKFNLEGSDDDADFNFLTHKGKRIDDIDDFKDKISDSDDDYEDKDMRKGIMTDEMVRALNFGGGEEEDAEAKKKSREERHQEIMEKSKAYKYHA